jgi:hypothetical protein
MDRTDKMTEIGNRCFSWRCFVPNLWHSQAFDLSMSENCVKNLDFWHINKTRKQPEVAANRATVLCHT